MTTKETGGEAAADASDAAEDVLAAVAGQDLDGAPAELWAALSEALAGEASGSDESASDPSSGSNAATRSGVGRGLEATTGMVEQFLDEGLLRVVVVDIGSMRRPEPASNPAGQTLRDAVDAMTAARPTAEIRYLGPSDTRTGFDDPMAELVAGAGTASPELVSGALERAFGRDPGTLVRFVATLREALPGDTAIVLRGSSVTGHAYTSGEPFDAAGPGTSDLDIVAISSDALELFDPEARLFGGVNTLPLSDHAPGIAPALEPARRKCQEMVGRPVNIQVMSRWFLDLRAAVQGTPYVDLFVPPD